MKKSLPTTLNARPSLAAVRKTVRAAAEPSAGAFSARFFKTGKGEYGEGDRFLGIAVPLLRRMGRQFRDLSLTDCGKLLQSPFNEERALALMVLIDHYKRGDAAEREAVFRLFVRHRRFVNNWNLVDLSAPLIPGPHLAPRDRALLFKLIRSRVLWDRRIAVLATFHFIRQGDFRDTFKLVELLLTDKHDLMHKACGWMLREIGKRDEPVLEGFLQRHAAVMPRTMLRYAIERFPPKKRLRYLGMKSKRNGASTLRHRRLQPKGHRSARDVRQFRNRAVSRRSRQM
jgi:3-methyladenine DNA glycosylase AlkD